MKRLGKLPPRHDMRTLMFANYLRVAPGLPSVPASVDWTKPVKTWGMMLNDSLGDCVVAGAGHAIQTWTANARGGEVTVPDAAILAAYEAVGGYTPSDPSTDNGLVMLDFLNYWRKTGLGGHKILAFAAVNPKIAGHMNAAAYLFGGVYTGYALPASAQTQTTWSVVSTKGKGAPGSWGGHCMWEPIENKTRWGAVTWSAIQPTTRGFETTYCDEAYAILTAEWMDLHGKAPCGFDVNALLADLKAVAG